MHFDQPRQQELIDNLLRRNYTDADLRENRDALLVDLTPINLVLEAIDENRALQPPAVKKKPNRYRLGFVL